MPYWATLPLAGVVCFVFGFLMGFPALRLGGHYLAVATLALALAVPQLLKYKHLEHYTGGVQGIVLVKPEPPFTFRFLDQPLNADRWLYFFTLAVTIVMFVLAWNLLRGRVGRALIAIRDHPIAAAAMGINLPMFKSLTFGVSAAFTGVAGALGAVVIAFVSPDSFTVALSIFLLVGLVVGGLASIPGAFFGAHLHPVRAQHRRRDVEVGAGGDLRRPADHPDVPDAHRRDGHGAQTVGALATGCRASARQRQTWRFRSRSTRPDQGVHDMKLKHFSLAVAGIAAAAISVSTMAQKKYDTGATDKEIKIGDIKPYSGPASAYGTIGKAISAYFDKVNAEGGINGRKIKYISLDDGYNPAKTVEQARKLVEEDEVLFVFNPLGTPPNTAIHKYMNSKKVPQLFVATGATKWGDPKNFPWTMGWQPNYQAEGKIYAAHILETKPNAKIGVLYQNDDYGKDYLKGFEDGLGDKAKTMIVAKVSMKSPTPRSTARWSRSRARAPTPSSTSQRRSSPRRRSRRPPRSAGSRRTTSTTCRRRWARC